jgi:hypothetical protein
VTLDSNAIVVPTSSAPAPTPAPTPTPTPVVNSNNGLGQNAYVAPTVNENSSPIPTTNATFPGCSGGNKYNASTGELCVNTAVAAAKYNFGTVTLRNGSRGAAAKELQRFLNDKLNLGLKLDGIIGPKTIAVIKQWQKDHNLVADGLIGAKTKAQMNVEAGN